MIPIISIKPQVSKKDSKLSRVSQKINNIENYPDNNISVFDVKLNKKVSKSIFDSGSSISLIVKNK